MNYKFFSLNFKAEFIKTKNLVKWFWIHIIYWHFKIDPLVNQKGPGGGGALWFGKYVNVFWDFWVNYKKMQCSIWDIFVLKHVTLKSPGPKIMKQSQNCLVTENIENWNALKCLYITLIITNFQHNVNMINTCTSIHFKILWMIKNLDLKI